MKRTDLAGLALLAVLGAASCGRKPGTPGTGSDTGSGGSSAHAGGSGSGVGSSAPDGAASNPTAALVKDAFGGKLPAFPLLASDGNTAAVGIASPVGRSTVSTYGVAIFSGWTAASDAWGTNAQVMPVVDQAMATMLLDSAMGEDAPAPDRETLKARATAVTKRLADGGFSPFDGPAVTLGANDTTLGPVKLRITHDHDAALTVHLLDASGNELSSNTIAQQAMGHVADHECVSTPVARRAWLDTKRKRALVEIEWNAGPEMCNAPDREYGLWPIP